MTTKGMLGLGALGVLVAVDAVLVGLAVQHTSAPVTSAAGAAADVGTAARTGPDESPTSGHTSPTPSASPSPSRPSASPPAEPGTGVLVNLGAGSAVIRATPGRCGKSAGSVQLSTDGGATFTRTDLGEPAVIVRVSSADATHASVYAADPDCRSYALLQTADGGQTWERTDGTAGTWHLLAGAEPRVHAPNGVVDVPCSADDAVQDLSILSNDVAYVLCGGGTLFGTDDSGATWERRSEVPGSQAMDFFSESTGLVAASGDGSCPGVAVLRTENAGDSWDRAACLRGSHSAAAALAVYGDDAYVESGDARWTSADDGQSWAPTGD